MLNSNTLRMGNISQFTQLAGLQKKVPQLDYLQHEANQLVEPQLTLVQRPHLVQNQETKLYLEMIAKMQ